jgi:hypothetical protein
MSKTSSLKVAVPASKPEVIWGKPVKSVTTVAKLRFKPDPTANPVGIGILTDNTGISIQPGAGVLNAACMATLPIPIQSPDESSFYGYLNEIRGFIAKSSGARALLVVDAGGSVATYEFPYDGDVLGDFPDLSEGKSFFRQFLSREIRQPKSTNLPRPTLPPYVITIILTVQRRSVEDFCELRVDSVEASAIWK